MYKADKSTKVVDDVTLSEWRDRISDDTYVYDGDVIPYYAGELEIEYETPYNIYILDDDLVWEFQRELDDMRKDERDLERTWRE